MRPALRACDIKTREQYDDFEARQWRDAIAEKGLRCEYLDALERTGLALLAQRTAKMIAAVGVKRNDGNPDGA